MFSIILPIFLTLPFKIVARTDCTPGGYDRCIRIADPLVREPHLVFPDNQNDISIVCKTWDNFVDCLKSYTENCFSDQQRMVFNKAVESPIESVHKMCMQPSYQKEYLLHAPCIKSTITERNHCGLQYNLLVEQVEQGDIISKSTLCCSHDRFKQCVERETRKLCDRGISNGPATRFAGQIIDKALRFLQEQCINYIPNSGDCIMLTTDANLYSERSEPVLISTSSSEVYPWSTIQQESKEISIKNNVNPTPWLPINKNTESSSTIASSTTRILGSRTRPGSYGRSNSFSDSSTISNTVPMFSDVSSTTSTISTWGLSNMGPPTRETIQAVNVNKNEQMPNNNFNYGSTPSWMSSTSGETWYPAAGNQINNEVDEPNQLGLKKPKNNGIYHNTSRYNLLYVICVILSIFRI